MRYFRSFLLVFLFSVVTAFSAARRGVEVSSSSVLLSGEVLHQETKAPIPYASVGLLGESIGTITNEEGVFSLSIPAAQANKILRISAIGFEAQELKVADLAAAFATDKNVTISLRATSIQLPEVTVNPKEWKTKKIGGTAGTKTYFSHSFVIMPRPLHANLGREIGIQIDNDHTLSYLSKLNFCLHSNQYDQVKFRLNVYYLKNGKPSENLLPQDIFVSVTDKKTGWMQVDLEPYDLYLENDFVVSLEWIDCAPKTVSKYLSLSASMPGFQNAYHKDASQSDWKKLPAVGMGMNVVVQREK